MGIGKEIHRTWWIWIVVDAELAALYLYKGIPFTAALYALYAVIAVAGYFKWKREAASLNRSRGSANGDSPNPSEGGEA